MPHHSKVVMTKTMKGQWAEFTAAAWLVTKGYLIFKSTKNVEVIKIIVPTITDFVVAAVTYPVVISNGDMGADKTS